MILKYYTQIDNKHASSNVYLVDSHIYSMYTHRHVLLVQQFRGRCLLAPVTSVIVMGSSLHS